MTHKKTAFPDWIRRSWPSGDTVQEVKTLLDGLDLHTVCQSAHCPNQAECWKQRTATLMILGKECTRHCKFCAVNTIKHPAPPDPREPEKVAEAVQRLGLAHVVITSVTRDDLPDEGATHFAATVQAVKTKNPGTTVEVLTPDFGARETLIRKVMDTAPEVFGHNIETVERLHPTLRDRRFTYAQSLEALRVAAAMKKQHYIKSAFMLGCGETEEDIRRTLADLLEAGVTVVSMGQYLQPTRRHYPVKKYIAPEEFDNYEKIAYDMGFDFAVAGPFVRSSYRSEEVLKRPRIKR